ncbi:hypothetical protein M0812_25100 [Anaeramoeba flamelloides]|uniref:Uncharacterized protein n=1 Tax=Anaeramoeba flamelloides TaxID=1746091 RepID=A0AAV7YLB8_9EUKA|nr:hypothetical protein M0812_25100 [Anaeramoeba flamelloides]
MEDTSKLELLDKQKEEQEAIEEKTNFIYKIVFSKYLFSKIEKKKRKLFLIKLISNTSLLILHIVFLALCLTKPNKGCDDSLYKNYLHSTIYLIVVDLSYFVNDDLSNSKSNRKNGGLIGLLSLICLVVLIVFCSLSLVCMSRILQIKNPCESDVNKFIKGSQYANTMSKIGLMSKNYPLFAQSLLFRVSFHKDLSILKQEETENFSETPPDLILKRWVNFQLKKSGQNIQISNFSQDFKDCVVLVLLVSQISENDLLDVLLDEDLTKRSENFILQLKNTSYSNEMINPQDITNANEVQLVAFLARLFLWEPNLNNEEKKLQIPQSNQKIIHNTNKTTNSNDISSLLSRMESNEKRKPTNQKLDINSILSRNRSKPITTNLNGKSRLEQLLSRSKPSFIRQKPNQGFNLQKLRNENTNQNQNQNNLQETQIEKEKKITKIPIEPIYKLETKEIKKNDGANYEKLLKQRNTKYDHLKIFENRGSQMTNEQKIEFLKRKINKEEQRRFDYQRKIEKKNQKRNELEKQIQFRKQNPISISSILLLSQKLIYLSTLYKKNFIKILEKTLQRESIQIDQELMNLIQSLKKLEFEYPDSRAKFAIKLFARSFFGILKSHKYPKFKKRSVDVIKQNVMLLNPNKEGSMKKIFQNIIEELERNPTITQKNSMIFQAINSLFEYIYFGNVFRKKLIDELTDFLIQSEFLKSIDFNILLIIQLKSSISEKIDIFVSGIIEFETIINGIHEFFKFCNIPSPRNQSSSIIRDCKKYSMGRTIRYIIEKNSNEEEKKQINELINKITKKQSTELNDILERNSTILQEYLNEEDILFFTCILNHNITFEKYPKISVSLFNFFESLGLSLPFIHSCIVQQVMGINNINDFLVKNNLTKLIIIKYIHLYNLPYLRQTISQLVLEHCLSGNSFEINPELIASKEIFKENLKNLLTYFEKFINSIFGSIKQIPQNLQLVCSYIRQEVQYRFPNSILIGVGILFFHNFYCLAIKNSINFGLITNDIPTKAQEGLNIVLMIMEKLATGSIFGKEKPNFNLIDQYLRSKFKLRSQFLNQISSNSSSIKEQSLFIPRYKTQKVDKRYPIPPILSYILLIPNANEKIPKTKFAGILFKEIKRQFAPTDNSIFTKQDIFLIKQFQQQLQNYLTKCKKRTEIINKIHLILKKTTELSDGNNNKILNHDSINVNQSIQKKIQTEQQQSQQQQKLLQKEDNGGKQLGQQQNQQQNQQQTQDKKINLHQKIEQITIIQKQTNINPNQQNEIEKTIQSQPKTSTTNETIQSKQSTQTNTNSINTTSTNSENISKNSNVYLPPKKEKENEKINKREKRKSMSRRKRLSGRFSKLTLFKKKDKQANEEQFSHLFIRWRELSNTRFLKTSEVWYLTEDKNKRKWSKQYITLKNNLFAVFSSKPKQQMPSQIYQIVSSTSVVSAPVSEYKKPNAITLTFSEPKKVKIIISISSKRDSQAWIKEINRIKLK